MSMYNDFNKVLKVVDSCTNFTHLLYAEIFFNLFLWNYKLNTYKKELVFRNDYDNKVSEVESRIYRGKNKCS